MNLNGKILTAMIAALVVGVLLGLWYGNNRKPTATATLTPGGPHTTPPPNFIRMEIENDTNRAVLAPTVGDTVVWFTQATKDHPPLPVTISFQGQSPCREGNNVASCHVDKSGIYEYQCTSTGCEDPGVDPRSNTSPTVMMVKGPGGGPGTLSATAHVATAAVSCDQNQNPQLSPDPVTITQDQAKDQKIRWIFGDASNVTVRVTPSSSGQFCSEAAASATQELTENPGGTVVCSVVAPSGTTATYTVTGACTNSNGTFHIKVN